MSITQCVSCGYVSSRAINCAGTCGKSGTMIEVDEEKDRLRERLDDMTRHYNRVCEVLAIRDARILELEAMAVQS